MAEARAERSLAVRVTVVVVAFFSCFAANRDSAWARESIFASSSVWRSASESRVGVRRSRSGPTVARSLRNASRSPRSADTASPAPTSAFLRSRPRCSSAGSWKAVATSSTIRGATTRACASIAEPSSERRSAKSFARPSRLADATASWFVPPSRRRLLSSRSSPDSATLAATFASRPSIRAHSSLARLRVSATLSARDAPCRRPETRARSCWTGCRISVSSRLSMSATSSPVPRRRSGRFGHEGRPALQLNHGPIFSRLVTPRDTR